MATYTSDVGKRRGFYYLFLCFTIFMLFVSDSHTKQQSKE